MFFKFLSSFHPKTGVHLYEGSVRKPMGICKLKTRSKYVCKALFQVLPALKSSL